MISNPAYAQAEKHGRYTGGIDPTIPLWNFDRASNTMSVPRGYGQALTALLRKHGISWQVAADNRVLLDPVDFGSKIELRDYQDPAVEAALRATGGVLVAPAGSGKTQMGLEIIARLRQPALWLTHTLDLAKQAINRADENLSLTQTEIGMVGAGRHRIGNRLTIGIIQTLINMDLSELAGRFGTVIVDECFPAGTLIDGKPIETITVGDTVTAWDESSRQPIPGKVVRLFKRPAPSRLIKLSIGEEMVICTPTHPFLTLYGWVPAILLTEGRELIYVAETAVSDLRESQEYQQSEIAVSHLPSSPNAGTFKDRDNLQRMREAGHIDQADQEGSVPRLVRVDRVEVLKPGSDGTFGGLCPDGYVYNFEVEDFHTYTANGFVVHNCHHGPAPTWTHVINQLPARYRFGLTATPKRADGLEIITTRVLGPVCSEVPRSAVKDASGIITPRLRTINTGIESQTWRRHEERVADYQKRAAELKLQGEAVPKPPLMPFGAILDELLTSEERNRLIVETLLKECPGHYSLVLSKRVEHCLELAYLLNKTELDRGIKPRLRTSVVHGKLDKKVRANILELAQAGKCDILFAVEIAKEGLDIPRLDRLFLVGGGRNEAVTEQQVGRIQRDFPGKVDAVVFDFVDELIPPMRAQHWKRRAVYRQLGMVLAGQSERKRASG